jgi:hypothetical protein
MAKPNSRADGNTLANAAQHPVTPKRSSDHLTSDTPDAFTKKPRPSGDTFNMAPRPGTGSSPTFPPSGNSDGISASSSSSSLRGGQDTSQASTPTKQPRLTHPPRLPHGGQAARGQDHVQGRGEDRHASFTSRYTAGQAVDGTVCGFVLSERRVPAPVYYDENGGEIED